VKKFSVVVPVYFNEKNLLSTIGRLSDVANQMRGYETEFIFVDDGSGDKSLDVLVEHRKQDKRIKIVKLTRNFGAMAAIQAGFSHATGDVVGMISADLQDPPEMFLDMMKHWENGIKTIFAVRRGRKDPWLTTLFSNTYYALLRRFGVRGFPPGGFDFFLIDREVVDKINTMQEKNTHLMPLIFWLGYEYVLLPYVREKRERGRSRWTFAKKFKLFIDSFVSFSYVPIRFVSVLGFIFAAVSFMIAISLFFSWRGGVNPVPVWLGVSTIVVFVSGIQMMMIGLIGEYLWRTLDASRRRPQYVIDKVYT